MRLYLILIIESISPSPSFTQGINLKSPVRSQTAARQLTAHRSIPQPQYREIAFEQIEQSQLYTGRDTNAEQ